MVFGKILIEKLKTKGVTQAEVVLAQVFESIQESAQEASVHPEADTAEKTVCSLAIPVLSGFKPLVDSAIDLNKDGKIG